MALLRYKRPEHLKERDPAAFGRLLGLRPRAPEVKTLRRRLTRLAAHHCASSWAQKLARMRVDQRGHLTGFLYVDGHVRAYHGQRPISSNAYVARRHLAMPASTDYWINDSSGDPLLVIYRRDRCCFDQGLPRLLREVREVVGERKVTIVFDRGGWSPKLFATMIKSGFDVLTYRKGRCRRINERRFVRRRAVLLRMRGMTIFCTMSPCACSKASCACGKSPAWRDGGHQTTVITSRWDMRDIEIAYPHVRALAAGELLQVHARELLLDALVDYQIEREDPTHTIPNPQRRALDKEIRAARADLASLEREFGAAAQQC